MHFAIIAFASLATYTFAAPTSTASDNVYENSHYSAQGYARLSKRAETANRSATCDTKNITLPPHASGLPAPTGQKLLRVAVGRGTQNYTCDNQLEPPVSDGAFAYLFDATCIAAKDANYLNRLPLDAYDIKMADTPSTTTSRLNIPLIGHHFFRDSKTPVFDLDTSAKKDGIAVTKQQKSIEPPSNSYHGRDGAVPWLYLTTIDGTQGNYKSVYRVQTASGLQHGNCISYSEHESVIVQYAAIYYFYGS